MAFISSGTAPSLLLHIGHFKIKQMRPRGFPNMLLTRYV